LPSSRGYILRRPAVVSKAPDALASDAGQLASSVRVEASGGKEVLVGYVHDATAGCVVLAPVEDIDAECGIELFFSREYL
jgi:hypothetical protein